MGKGGFAADGAVLAPSPLPDASVDVVLSFEPLEHLKAVRRQSEAMREAPGIRPHGDFCVTLWRR